MNMRELEDYLKYLEYQKNYSKHTIDSYQIDIEEYLEYNLITLMEEIRTNNYKLSNYSSFVIYEPKKRRIVSQNMNVL